MIYELTKSNNGFYCIIITNTYTNWFFSSAFYFWLVFLFHSFVILQKYLQNKENCIKQETVVIVLGENHNYLFSFGTFSH